MADESEQNASHTTEILQSNSLAQRLNQRRTHPVGLVNRQRLARLPKPIVQRFALIDQLKTRYGARNNSSGTDTELTFATPPSTVAQTNTLTGGKTEYAKSALTTPPTTSPAGNSPSSQTFRISRKAIPFASQSNLSSALSSAKSENLDSLKHHVNTPGETSGSQLFRVKSLAANSGMVGQMHSSVILRKENDNQNTGEALVTSTSALNNNLKESPATDKIVQSKAISTSPKPIAQETPQGTIEQTKEFEPILRAKPLMPQTTTEQTEGLEPILRAKPLAPQATIEQTKELNPIFLAQPLTPQKSTLVGQASSRGAATISTGVSTGVGRQVSTPTATATASVLQLKAGNTYTTNEHSTSFASASTNQNKVAISSEMPVTGNSVSKPSMVWRKSFNEALPGNNFSDAIHNGQLIAQKATTANTSVTMPASKMQASNAMSANTTPMTGQATIPVPQINVAQIAEQVSRILCRQLTVERERRGIRI